MCNKWEYSDTIYIECAGLIVCRGDRGVMRRYLGHEYRIDNIVSSERICYSCDVLRIEKLMNSYVID